MKAVWIALIAALAWRADVFSVCHLLEKMSAHDGDQKWQAATWLAFSNASNKLDEES
jgi:hypothetical protein